MTTLTATIPPPVTHRPKSATTRPFGHPPAAAVLDAARRAGPICRDELAGATGLSHATVNRQVAGCWRPACCASGPTSCRPARSAAPGTRRARSGRVRSARHPHRAQPHHAGGR